MKAAVPSTRLCPCHPPVVCAGSDRHAQRTCAALDWHQILPLGISKTKPNQTQKKEKKKSADITWERHPNTRQKLQSSHHGSQGECGVSTLLHIMARHDQLHLILGHEMGRQPKVEILPTLLSCKSLIKKGEHLGHVELHILQIKIFLVVLLHFEKVIQFEVELEQTAVASCERVCQSSIENCTHN